MKTARFSDVVKKCGHPEPYLVLIDPEKDKTLREAIKADRLMTVFQRTVGTKADSGIVGFEPGQERQFLIFPKTLRAFKARKIIGIKYDLWSSEELPKSRRPPAPRKPKASRTLAPTPTSKAEAKPRPRQKKESKNQQTASNVVSFPSTHEEDNSEIVEIKNEVRRAMDLLEEGKAVAAFNLLKRIVSQ